MARHDQVARLFSQGVFFANPGSPWMRGTNENTVIRGHRFDLLQGDLLVF